MNNIREALYRATHGSDPGPNAYFNSDIEVERTDSESIKQELRGDVEYLPESDLVASFVQGVGFDDEGDAWVHRAIDESIYFSVAVALFPTAL